MSFGRKQRTFTVPEHGEIRIISRAKTNQRNFIGWSVEINGQKFFRAVLDRDEAEELAFFAWVRRKAENKRLANEIIPGCIA